MHKLQTIVEKLSITSKQTLRTLVSATKSASRFIYVRFNFILQAISTGMALINQILATNQDDTDNIVVNVNKF